MISRSRWRELNPRPIPYQGIAIPLSHSGISDTALNTKGGYFTFFLVFRKIPRKTIKNHAKRPDDDGGLTVTGDSR